MLKKEIVDYVMHTPGNVNKKILEQMLNQLENSIKEQRCVAISYSGGLYHNENKEKIEFTRVSDVILDQNQLKNLTLTGKFIYKQSDSNNVQEKEFICQVSEKENWQVKRISDTRLALQVPGIVDDIDNLLFVVEDWEDSEFNLAPGLYAPSPLDIVRYIDANSELVIGGQVKFDF